MSKGHKTCEKCGKECGPRTKVCECGQGFCFKPKSMRTTKVKTKKISDWKELKEGDIIKVSSKQPLGYSGQFKVKTIDQDGVVAYPLKADESGACFIFLGDERVTKFGTVLSPHNIAKVE